MAYDHIRLLLLAFKFIPAFAFSALIDHIRAVIQNQTYEAVDSAKNVVVIGGSFAGIQAAKKLASSVPTGYRVVLIEKNSHFNYTFNFPRYSVLQGRERLAFIPYENVAKGLPTGSLRVVRGLVKEVKRDFVLMESGEEVPYAFLVLATGCAQSPPARLESSDMEGACGELRAYQKAIETVEKVAVVGGGAVGVELVADVKSWYPEKEVTLVHSRAQLLPRFGPRLHEHVLSSLRKLGVEVLLGERPEILPSTKEDVEKNGLTAQSLRFNDGKVVDYDLVIPCTGQTPHSNIISSFIPNAISKSTGRILVNSHLQVPNGEKGPSNIFATGDVAETDGPKMARAAFFHASIVSKNIVSMSRGREPAKVYKPQPEIEGALHLSLGRTEAVTYFQSSNGKEILLTSSKGGDDLEVDKAWRFYGADITAVKSELE